ncbi:hypothetical protein IW262DRAFT_1302724 [Armillaria fumosa]|nr:hypothetical protein IW262DRAFT_1302724 [Armillaria fumosa]
MPGGSERGLVGLLTYMVIGDSQGYSCYKELHRVGRALNSKTRLTMMNGCFRSTEVYLRSVVSLTKSFSSAGRTSLRGVKWWHQRHRRLRFPSQWVDITTPSLRFPEHLKDLSELRLPGHTTFATVFKRLALSNIQSYEAIQGIVMATYLEMDLISGGKMKEFGEWMQRKQERTNEGKGYGVSSGMSSKSAVNTRNNV